MRYERKLVSTSHDLSEVLSTVRLHPSFFRPIYHEREVNNIYFDTVDLKFLAANREGTGNRKKYRLRWYGSPDADIVNAQLELKRRVGQLVDKQVWPQGTVYTDHWIKETATPNALPAEELEQFKLLRPTMLSGYTRQYFLSVDGRFRITVDFDQWWHNLIDGQQKEDNRRVIVEIKYDPDADRDAGKVSGGFPFRVAKWSKYAAGFSDDS